jgi:arylsulfatase A-like enzyme/Tfp pilus assembly protein PilF
MDVNRRAFSVAMAGAFALSALLLVGCQRESDAPVETAEPAVSTVPTAPVDPAALNVVVITLDTTRADALGSYGQRRPITPNLDRIAAEGTQFMQAVSSAPSTLPSHSTLFTGQHPFVHGVRSNAGYVLSEENTTLAEALSAEGYRTAAEIAAPVIGEHTQLGQGFDRYHDLEYPDVQRKTVHVKEGDGKRAVEIDEREADDITKFGLRFIKQNRDRKFFLWLHYFDAHQPYSPPARFYDTSSESPYHGEIQYIDEQIGRVLEQIEGLGLRERTLVVVTADHGEAMGEHDEMTHMYFVYDGTIRVPLLFWGAAVPEGLKVESLVRTVDVTPTILDMLDMAPLAKVQGRSLLPLLEGETLDLDLLGYGESIEVHHVFSGSVLRFVRKGQWKYIHKVEPELFDLSVDPGELENLSSTHPDIVEKMRRELWTLIEEAPEQASGARTSIDPETAAQLEALGYMSFGPTEDLGDEVDLLEVSGINPASLTEDMHLVSRASGLRLTKDYERSAEVYREVVERNPESVPLLMRFAQVLRELDDTEERFVVLTRVIELAPEVAAAYSDLAHVMFVKGDPEEAERLLAASLSIEPCASSPRATLAFLAAQRNDRGRHLQLLKEGVEQCPPADGILNNYAYALATNPEQEYRDGEEALRIAEEITQNEKGQRPDYLDTLACAYAEMGDFVNAARIGEQVVAMHDANGDPALIDEAKAHLEQFRAGQAVRSP